MKYLNSMYGYIYYLKLPFEEIERRCNKLDSRGVVLKKGQTFKNLYDERIPLYEKYSNFTLEKVTLEELNTCRTKTTFSPGCFS